MALLKKIVILKISKGSTIYTSKSVVTGESSEVEDVTNLTLLDSDDGYTCEYKDEIWRHLLQEDARRPTFYMRSPQLEFRSTLVQQLRDLTRKLELSLATLHSAVTNLDLFMDSHDIMSDELIYFALACLSLAAKSEEVYSQTPSLKELSRISNVHLDGKSFCQVEWMVAEHVEWRLLAPTAVHFAEPLSQYLVTDKDLTTRNSRLLLRLKSDASKFLDEYLDLSLSDVHLRTVDAVDVGCACIACARMELGFMAWPHWLFKKVNRPSEPIARLAALLEKMMRINRTRENKSVEPEVVDGGYISSGTSVSSTPNMSPELINIDSSLPSGTPNDNMPGVKPKEVEVRFNKLLSQPDTNIQRVNLTEHAYCKNDTPNDNMPGVKPEEVEVCFNKLLSPPDTNIQRVNLTEHAYCKNDKPNDNMPGLKPKEAEVCFNKLLSQPDTNIQRVNLTEHAYCKNDKPNDNMPGLKPKEAEVCFNKLLSQPDTNIQRVNLTEHAYCKNDTPNDNMPGVKPKEVEVCFNKLLSHPDTNIERVNLTEHAYCKNDRTIENTLNITEEPINLTKKHHLLRDTDDEVETKRVCLASYLMNFEP